MFHVYGVGGRLYSGGAENLPVVPVQRIEQLSSVQRFMVDERPPEEPALLAPPPAAPRSARANEAVSAYGQAAHPDLAPIRLPRLASQVMTTTVVTVQADATLAEAAAWMQRENVGQAPVIDERQQLVGLLGRAQLLSAASAWMPPTTSGEGEPTLHTVQTVRDVMVSPVPAALTDTEVHLVARVMLQADLPGLPVVDAEGGLSGFISRGDLLRVMADEPALEVWA